jgi:xylulokinase
VNHAVESPQAGWVEQDADRVWWGDAVAVIQALLSHPQADREAVAGIGISGLFPALLIADAQGRPLRPALLYSDNRAAAEMTALSAEWGFALTGDAVAPKLLWLRDHEPENFRQARRFFSAHNYVVYRLTGVYCLDHKVADSMQALLDRQNLQWRPDYASRVGIDAAWLPPLRPAQAAVGGVSAEAAEATGLKRGAPVIAGSGDSLMTLLAAGVIRRGEALLSFGTTGWMGILAHSLEAYFENPGLIADGAPYRLEAYLLSLGSLLEWYGRHFAVSQEAAARHSHQSVYSLLDEAAEQLPPGSDGATVLPYFMGGRRVGAPEPETGSIHGLTLQHTPAHLYRAILESFGCAARSALEDLRGQGIETRRIVSAGGGARSRLWRQIVSSILELPLDYHAEVNPCLGGAYLAGYGLGLLPSLDGIQDWLPGAEQTHPQPETRAAYREAYQRFVSLRALVAGHSHTVSVGG